MSKLQEFLSSNNGSFHSNYEIQKVSENSTLDLFATTVTFWNKGLLTATLKGNLQLKAGESITFGGSVESVVNDTFEITFEAETTPNVENFNLLVIKEFIIKK